MSLSTQTNLTKRQLCSRYMPYRSQREMSPQPCGARGLRSKCNCMGTMDPIPRAYNPGRGRMAPCRRTPKAARRRPALGYHNRFLSVPGRGNAI